MIERICRDDRDFVDELGASYTGGRESCIQYARKRDGKGKRHAGKAMGGVKKKSGPPRRQGDQNRVD